MIHRIAFAGASGTGKTFLSKILAARLGLELQPSFAREVAADWKLASPYDVDALGKRDEFQVEVAERTLRWQLERKAKGFIADRSIWDQYTYTSLHASTKAVADVLAGMVRYCFQMGLPVAQAYTKIIVCPIDSFFNMGDDPARKNDEAYQREFERVLLAVIGSFGKAPVDMSLVRVKPEQREAWARALGDALASSVGYEPAQ